MKVAELKRLLADQENVLVEDLMLASSQLQIIDSNYQEKKLPTPEWVTDKLGEVAKEITNRLRASLQLRLKQAKARRAALSTREEQRSAADREIAALEGLLKD